MLERPNLKSTEGVMRPYFISAYNSTYFSLFALIIQPFNFLYFRNYYIAMPVQVFLIYSALIAIVYLATDGFNPEVILLVELAIFFKANNPNPLE